MNWKKFLKPTVAKVITSPILLILVTFGWHTKVVEVPLGGVGRFGLPFTWVISAAAGPGGHTVGGGIVWRNLIIDLLFWYFVVCSIVFLFKVVARKYKSN